MLVKIELIPSASFFEAIKKPPKEYSISEPMALSKLSGGLLGLYDFRRGEAVQVACETGKITTQKKIDVIIKERLSMSLKKNIKSINSKYEGKIWGKTKEPHKLILKVMCIMNNLNFRKEEITWGSIKEFIEDNIHGNPEFMKVSELQEIDDHIFKVREITLTKKQCQDSVPVYKRTILFVGN